MIDNSSFENMSELDSTTMKADQHHSLESMMGMVVASTSHAILMQSLPKIFQVKFFCAIRLIGLMISSWFRFQGNFISQNLKCGHPCKCSVWPKVQPFLKSPGAKFTLFKTFQIFLSSYIHCTLDPMLGLLLVGEHSSLFRFASLQTSPLSIAPWTFPLYGPHASSVS